VFKTVYPRTTVYLWLTNTTRMTHFEAPGYTEHGERLQVGEELSASQEKLHFRQLLNSSVLQ